MKLAIKIDVDGIRPALVGAPRLAHALKTAAAGASFFFSLGPDRSGRRLGRLFHRGMLRHLWRTRSIRDYGLRTYLYGSLLSAPDLGVKAAATLCAIHEAGFETGVRAYDHIEWCERATLSNAVWIGQQMALARDRYEDILGEPAYVHAAAGWKMNRHAYRCTQRLEFAYSSDTRGTHPFIPVFRAEVIFCPQLPTTLPTMEELLADSGVPAQQVVAKLLALTEKPGPWGHVFSANAAFEGLKLLAQFEELLNGWRQQGYEIVSLRDYMLSIDTRELPYHEVITGTVPGRPSTVELQGKEFLS
ncbi:MAG: 4-deoxy-4-formamido-L-arabinose-phosphoundecaprenol deformylase [Betaproteobacteria bacterium]|nr:MAG: 4-deoxy-4-formamido-L-arabinose-phosphoundecaprenol deformylase [Betaproteobacteria bacterium]